MTPKSKHILITVLFCIVLLLGVLYAQLASGVRGQTAAQVFTPEAEKSFGVERTASGEEDRAAIRAELLEKAKK